MRIHIKTTGKSFTFRVPLAIFFSKIAWKMLKATEQEENCPVPISYDTAKAMQKELRSYLKIHGHFRFLQVETADGTYVELYI